MTPADQVCRMTTAEVDLSAIGDCINKQLYALASDRSPSRAADVAICLDGARRAVLRMREALMQEVPDAGAG